jgi:hypothetical protein
MLAALGVALLEGAEAAWFFSGSSTRINSRRDFMLCNLRSLSAEICGAFSFFWRFFEGGPISLPEFGWSERGSLILGYIHLAYAPT